MNLTRIIYLGLAHSLTILFKWEHIHQTSSNECVISFCCPKQRNLVDCVLLNWNRWDWTVEFGWNWRTIQILFASVSLGFKIPSKCEVSSCFALKNFDCVFTILLSSYLSIVLLPNIEKGTWVEEDDRANKQEKIRRTHRSIMYCWHII